MLPYYFNYLQSMYIGFKLIWRHFVDQKIVIFSFFWLLIHSFWKHFCQLWKIKSTWNNGHPDTSFCIHTDRYPESNDMKILSMLGRKNCLIFHTVWHTNKQWDWEGYATLLTPWVCVPSLDLLSSLCPSDFGGQFRGLQSRYSNYALMRLCPQVQGRPLNSAHIIWLKLR